MKKVISVVGVIFLLSSCSITTTGKVDIVKLLKDQVRYTADWETDCEDTTIQLTQEDAMRLMKISTAEAASEGVEGQLKVMQVVINRVNSESPEYPDTIKEVIEQKAFSNGEWHYQFCTVREGTYYDAEPDVNAHLALAQLESNRKPDTDIIAFETSTNGNALTKWFDIAYQYKNHIFYRAKKRTK